MVKNQYVDLIRGIAILLVVLGHTITKMTFGYENTVLFNVIWSLQMPLFFLISGYITKYSKEIITYNDFFLFLKRRSFAYLVPLFTWTFIVRGILLSEHSFFNIKYIAFHMDAGYWFLFCLWVICVIFGVSSLICSKTIKLCRNKSIKPICISFICMVFIVILFGIGKIISLDFLAIKLTCYYMPIYLLGFVFGQYCEQFNKYKSSPKVIYAVIAIAFLIWVYVILNISVFETEENLAGISVRFVSSILGCTALVGLIQPVYKNYNQLRIWKLFSFAGTHSLEIYLMHTLCLTLAYDPIKCGSLQSVMVLMISYAYTIFITVIVTVLINQNNYLKRFLLGKGNR